MAADRWMDIAKSYLGLKESPGAANNPKVVELFKLAGHPDVTTDSTAWCAAFAGAVLKRAGMQGTGSLLARSYLKWEGGVPTTKPVYGDVVIFKRGNSNWQGHVAFFVREEGDYVYALGGNQSDSVCYMKFPKSTVLGYRRPIEPPAKGATNATGYLPEVGVGVGGAAAAAQPFISGDMLLGGIVVFVTLLILGGLFYFRNKEATPAKKTTKKKTAAKTTTTKKKAATKVKKKTAKSE